jgi:Mn-dependent DtxR family transcriptional regulator
MAIHKSAEDYLEKILMIQNKNGIVRAIDIARFLDFSKASVSVAMKKLKENDYIEVNKNGDITLTQKGLEVANKVYERHEVLASLFIKIGVPQEIAYEDACKIEHDISDETFEALKKHYNECEK